MCPVEELNCPQEKFSNELLLFVPYPDHFGAIFDEVKCVSLLSYCPVENKTTRLHLVSHESMIYKASEKHKGKRVWPTNFSLRQVFVPLPHKKIQ